MALPLEGLREIARAEGTHRKLTVSIGFLGSTAFVRFVNEPHAAGRARMQVDLEGALLRDVLPQLVAALEGT